MRMRNVFIRAALSAALAAPVALVGAAPAAWAVRTADGDQPGPGISTGASLLVYAGIPLAIFVLLALLTYAPSLARGPRYRPGLTWFATPVWFNGPDDTSAPDPTATGATRLEPAAPPHEGGGASARW